MYEARGYLLFLLVVNMNTAVQVRQSYKDRDCTRDYLELRTVREERECATCDLGHLQSKQPID